MSREKKRFLEPSIDRVIKVLKQDAVSDDEVGSMEDCVDAFDSASEPSISGVNKSIVDSWRPNLSKADAAQFPSTGDQTSKPAVPSIKKRHISGEPLTKRRKVVVGTDRSPPTHVSLADLGGVDHIIQQLEDLIVLPLLQPEIYATSKIQPPRGLLLHGPPGCGKTMIANAFAAELGIPFIALSAPSIVSGMSGESEKAIRDHFEEAKKMAPCLVFIDEFVALRLRFSDRH